jgi:TRAP-type C4-dicarboxylate transport system substrate-binding protein
MSLPPRRSRVVPLLLVLGAALLSAAPLPALTLKFATLAPVGSPWVESLRRLAGDLERETGGAVTFKIYPGGVAGEEADLVRKMRIGQLQGAALTQLGLALLEPGLLALSTPFLIEGDEELDYVMAGVRSEYGRQLESRGYHLLAFTKAGWVHFFGRREVATPDDLRGQRLGLPDGDAVFVETWRRMGFNAFSLPFGDLLVGLQSGMVDAYYAPPAVAASFQWFNLTPHMSQMRIAPVIGGVVLSETALRQIPERFRARFRARFRELESELNEEMMALEQDALAAMLSRGVVIDPVRPEVVAEWKRLGNRGAEVVIGRVFSRSDYELVAAEVEEHRKAR